MHATTVSMGEIARFDALAPRWWDPDGPMRALHRMNPARVAWIAERTRASRLLDLGCGAGLAAEALARRGHEVLGVDASSAAIETARSHAEGQNLRLAYRVGTAEDLLADGLRFSVITALEVIEHVPDPPGFLATLAALLEPGGQLFLSTLNRTPQSFLAAKVGAEYLLRWLPVGTHDWRRFITPVELAAMLRRVGLRITEITGLIPRPLTGTWATGHDLSVNYLLAAEA